MLNKELVYGYGLNIFSIFKILKIKDAIKKGDKTARNYAVLADWYGMFSMFKHCPEAELFYALKSIRADRNYPQGYLYAADAYWQLGIKEERCLEYLIKAANLGGKDYFLPRLLMFGCYLEKEDGVMAYKTGTEYLSHKVNTSEYWAMALYVISAYYGFGLEYKNALKRYFHYVLREGFIPRFIGLVFVLLSLFIVAVSGYLKWKNNSSGSIILNQLMTDSADFEVQLALVNKLIIREKRTKSGQNTRLAGLYILKANAHMYKEETEYEKAIEVLEKFRQYGDEEDKIDYYWYKANYAYCAKDYNNAITYANEALLHKPNGRCYQIKGFSYFAIDKYKEAEDSIIKSLDFDNCNKALSYFYLASTQFMMDNYKDALVNINKALLIEKDSITLYTKARCLERLGQIDEAKKYYKLGDEMAEQE